MTAAAFKAVFTDWRLIKGRKCVSICFEVPLELADEAYRALGGMPDPGASVWCAIARLQIAGNAPLLPEAPAREAGDSKAAPPASASHHSVTPHKRLAQRAGILCSEPMFRRFVEIETKAPMGEVTEEAAANYIRSTCQVESRSEIQPGTVAADRFAFILSAYIAWKEKDRYVAA